MAGLPEPLRLSLTCIINIALDWHFKEQRGDNFFGSIFAPHPLLLIKKAKQPKPKDLGHFWLYNISHNFPRTTIKCGPLASDLSQMRWWHVVIVDDMSWNPMIKLIEQVRLVIGDVYWYFWSPKMFHLT